MAWAAPTGQEYDFVTVGHRRIPVEFDGLDLVVFTPQDASH